MQDKIAEHIAKFNAPEGSEFFWVSFTKGKAEKHRNELYLECLMLKVDSENWVWLSMKGKFNKISCTWPYTLKHEQKGEQMRSVELRPTKFREYLDSLSALANHLDNEFKGGWAQKVRWAIGELQKPIPTGPRWSEEEIRGVMIGDITLGVIEGIIEDLKTPKPRLRDRTFKEKLIWLSEQNFPEYYVFKKDLESEDRLQLSDFSKYYNVGLNPTDPWLPIPPIEIEIEIESEK